MNNKTIEALNYMGEKIGIAIDWTAENVVPQVTEFLGRYQLYSIIKNGVWVLIGIAIIVTICVIFKSMITDYKMDNDDSIWFDRNDVMRDIGFVTLLFGFIAIVAFSIVTLCCIFSIIEWSFVPEAKFFQVITNYIKQIH